MMVGWQLMGNLKCMVMVKSVLECKEYKPSLTGRVIDENWVTLEQRKKNISNVGGVLTSLLPSERIVLLGNVLIRRRMTWSIGSSVGGSTIDPSSADSPNGGTRTRLIRAIQAFRTKLGARIKELRKDLPMKVFFLVGFYCATAFATVIGQTGDWDILSTALAVVVVEGIGALMYEGSFPLLNKIRSLITMFNYWKAGLSLGLFLDSFKYEMDNIIGSSNPFNFEIDIFSVFLKHLSPKDRWQLMCFMQSRPPITKKRLVHRNQDLSVNLEATWQVESPAKVDQEGKH